jgi:transcriptional regulator with XRE-family HTH domain
LNEFQPERLSRLRAERGWSLREAAKATGGTKETISELEHGKRKPHPGTLRKLANGFGVPVRYFLEPSTPKEPSRLSHAAPEKTSGEERRNLEEVWKEQYLARGDEMLDKWESEIEEMLPLAETDLVRFFKWLEEIWEFGNPYINGLISAYETTAKSKLQAVVGATTFLSPYYDLWLRIEECVDQTTTLSKEDEKRVRELYEKARAVR